MLTEDNIKQVFIPFLKEFYKYRYEYRPETAQVALDNVSAGGGVIADGMLSFRRTDDTPFVCTYEATSRDKMEEVKYTLNVPYFLWDCAAFSGIFTALIYLFLFTQRLPWLIGLQAIGNIGLLIGTFMIGFLVWYFAMREWRKYRYIYAVEQFRQYFADEQWVALAEDVFPAPTDPYFLELKDQCIFHGFGLAVVLEQGGVRPIVTPSRLGMYGKDRRMLQWVTHSQWYQAVSGNLAIARRATALPSTWTRLYNKVHHAWDFYVSKPIGKGFSAIGGRQLERTQHALNRFMKGRPTQQWVFYCSWALILFLLTKTLRNRHSDVADVAEINRSGEITYNPENQPLRYEVNEPIPDPARGMVRQYPQEPAEGIEDGDDGVGGIQLSKPTPAKPQETPTIDLSGGREAPSARTSNAAETKAAAEKPAASASGSGSTPAANLATISACNVLRKGWYIQDTKHTVESGALARLQALQRRGLSCFATRRSCVEAQDGYIVFLDKRQANEKQAVQTASNYVQALERYGLLKSQLMVRPITQ